MTIFIEISLIIVVAALISGITRLLKQPLIIGYIVAGLLVGPSALNLIQSPESLEVFSQFGITLLLFIVGLSLSPKVIREVGRVALITGVGQVVFTSAIGFVISMAFGFSIIESVYIAIALTFSSTIIILKLLSDKGDLDKLYGKISVGFLLVQDIIATLILIVISASQLGSSIPDILFQVLWKGILLVAILLIVVKYLLPGLTKFFAKSQEFLFLFSIAWGMGLASLFSYLGFSLEIGALIAGVTLSLFPYNHEISAKMRPLRDFFLILFFILLGAQLSIGDIQSYLLPVIVFSLFVLIGNPLIVMILTGLLKYNKRTGFLAGLTVAQISEFSLILVALGQKMGHLPPQVISLVTVVGLVTITGSSYLIMYSGKIYPRLAGILSIFERKDAKSAPRPSANYDVILFGYNRIGYNFLAVFRKISAKYMVVDYDPETIADLLEVGVPCKYGDAGDSEFLDELNLSSLKMAVSTVPDYDTNCFLIEKVRSVNSTAIIMVVSHDISCAYDLYEKGASYVVMPHFLGGEYASSLVSKHHFDMKKFDIEREHHIKHLNKRQGLGHEHPHISNNG